jgi:hypothetical protein
MSRWTIAVAGKNIRQASLDKLVKDLRTRDGATVTITDATPPSSRAARLEAAMSQVSEAASEVESLKDELQEWYDNLPENFQNGEKGETLQSAIDELESLHDELEGIDGSSIEFPGMY